MKEKELYDWDNITIVPATLSDISSRSEINILHNDKLPLFVSPMDMVIDYNNSKTFKDLGFEVCLPRGENDNSIDSFYSYSLSEVIDMIDNKIELPKRLLIDIANGHMKLLYETSKIIKEDYNIELMVGNIANPETYRKFAEIGVDYIRCGIGAGSGCTTSSNGAIHYPMASLITECYEISKEFEKPTKIVADGGFKKFTDIIKALACGADYVMLGGIVNKSLESASDNYKLVNDEYYKILDSSALERFNSGESVYKYFRGMSTKEVQKKWGRKELKTAEGVSFYNKVEYKISGWVENFSDYLKTNMSYSNIKDIKDYPKYVDIRKITPEAYNRFNK